MKRYTIIALILILICSVKAQADLKSQLYGASVYSAEYKPVFIGELTNKFASESIFNEFGTYGSQFSSKSIWNQFSTYGSKFSSYSAMNQYAFNPPYIVKGGFIIARLTTNKNVEGAINPYLLKALFE
jgi:hypothetical protein